MMLPCVSISQTTDTIRLSVKDVYFGLKAGEHYKTAYTECAQAVDSLNSLVQEQDYTLNQLIEQSREQDAVLENLYKDAIKAERKKTWWIGAGAFLLGILFVSL